MFQRRATSHRRRERWILVYIVLVVTLMMALGGTGSLTVSIARAQDESTSTEVAVNQDQSEQSPSDESETNTDAPPDDEETTNPDAPATDVSDPSVPEEPTSDEGVTEEDSDSGEISPVADDAVNGETGEPESEATPGTFEQAPTLSYAPAAEPSCALSPNQSAQIAHGGFLDYDCVFAVTVASERLAPADIQLDWSVQATVDGGWIVQMLPPRLDPSVAENWSAAQATTQIVDRTGIANEPSTEVIDSFESTSELAFVLRIHRPTCSVDAQVVRLDLAVDGSLPALTDATVARNGLQPATFELTPDLAPIPQPTVAFTGALDFGEIRMTTEGPVAPLKPAESVLTVTGLDQACGDYELKVSSAPFSGPDDTESTISLALASIDTVALPDGDCAFADGCVIATLAAGPDAKPVVTFTLGVSLVLPAQPRAAVFDSSLTAVLELVNPDADLAVAPQPDEVDG